MNICGDPIPVIDSVNSNYNDTVINLNLTYTHTSPTMNIEFETDLNSDRGWWGIRNLKVSMDLCDKSCKSCTNASI